MADVIERNTKQVNPPGTYRDPESGVSLEVLMEAGADALVRLGWQWEHGLNEAPQVQVASKAPVSNNEQ